MTKPTIALCVIARDCAKEITQLLESTQGVFDFYCFQDTGSVDNSTILAWEEYCKKVGKGCRVAQKFMGDGVDNYRYVEINGAKQLGDFGKARQDSFNLAIECGADYAMWADSDDVIVNAHFIPLIVKGMQKENQMLALMTYVYAQGLPQKRERIINIKVAGQWVDRVHEAYTMPGQIRITEVKECWLEHKRTATHVTHTGRRNNLIMLEQLKEEGLEKFSDKMLHNLAYDHWEHKEYDQAIKYFKIFLKRADRGADTAYETGIRIAKAYMEQSKFQKAILWAIKCIGWLDKRAEAYNILAECYDRIGNYTDAIYYCDRVLQIGKPNTTSPLFERDYSILPLRIKTHAFLSLGNLKSALECMQEIYRLSGDPSALAELRGLEGEMRATRSITGIAQLVQSYQESNEYNRLDKVLKAIPIKFRDNQTIRRLIQEIQSDFKRKSQKVQFTGAKTIAIYAGEQSLEPWDGESDIKKGIGGSEGMCIQLSRELAKLGNKVVVFNNCGESDGKVFDGVQYMSYRKWNSNIICDVFISLRRPDIFGQTMKAKKQYLWLHDTNYGEQSIVNFTSPNKVIVLSKAHRDVIKQSHFIEDDKLFWITRNGINPIALEYADKNAGVRDPYQIVYASSYDRGLDFILDNWKKIKDAVPQATLKICYGWDTYNAMMQMRQGTELGQSMYNYKQKITKQIIELDGVMDLGKLSQNDTYKLIKESGIWFYPTSFFEISCITAMSCQALGTIPICTPVGALNETVSDKYGIKLKQDNIVDGLIYYLKNQGEIEDRRDPMSKWAREAYSMEELGKQWNKFFNED